MTHVSLEVKLPKALTDAGRLAKVAARPAMVETIEETNAGIVQSRRLPRNTGALAQNIVPGKVEVRDDVITGRIIVRGIPVRYGVVMESGRRPRARGPSWRHLYFGPGATSLKDGWRTGWVFRRLRPAVNRLAAQLRKRNAPKNKRKGRAANDPRWLRAACFVLARAIARSIHARGIRAREFAATEGKKMPKRFRSNFLNATRALGWTG